MPSEIKFDLDEAIELLSRTPVLLEAMLSSLPEHWIKNNYGPETFSPFDVVGHLIHGDQTDWIPRARQILATQDEAPFTPFDRYAMYEASQGKTIAQLLDEFKKARQTCLKDLTAMTIEDAPHLKKEDRKSTRLNSSHTDISRMPSSSRKKKNLRTPS